MAALYRGPVINANPVVYSVPAHAAVHTPPPSSSSLAGASLPTALTPQEVYGKARLRPRHMRASSDAHADMRAVRRAGTRGTAYRLYPRH